MRVWIIGNMKEPKKFWSKDNGWVENETYSVFYSSEVRKMEFPTDGKLICLDWLA